ncbi:hypothetical protein P153DRAFT_3583 [Dothidotthia symphoricarpi CBS 119687]|uniref:Uncharacterized protein n=1 Tax=Dothidotthia symphoricarpi CBS 119687 TaxID=1392245 RepID=A0A6A6AU94_9PLEO|nr:uncharacterized protein P153DRAFT_3583 [Dothidotthia symphoricarpi CBS 119687]KAF2134524.1 hypothetical protein P153DRAFT_3583 [Dothidotthia symphoricarpi CBS 119687]
MCNYTFIHLECGHKVDDKAYTVDCLQFAQTGVACDPTDPANRRHLRILNVDKCGMCDNCLHKEGLAKKREEERSRKDSLTDVMEREKILRAHEERAIRESREDAERRQEERAIRESREDSERRHLEQVKRARELSLADERKKEKQLEVGFQRVSKQSKEEYDRMVQQKEESDIEYATRMSLEAAQRARQEEEDMIIAMRNSMMSDFEQGPFANDENGFVKTGKATDKDGRTWEFTLTKTVTHTATAVPSSPSSPPAPAAPRPSGAIPMPPPPPRAPSTPSTRSASSASSVPSVPSTRAAPSLSVPMPPPPPARRASAHKPAPPQRTPSKDFTCPPVGDQTIGHYTIGNRRQPILPTQEPQAPTSPTATHVRREPAPAARLGGQIGPDILSQPGPYEQIKIGQGRPNLRPSVGPKRTVSTPVENAMDPKLLAAMAKQRLWEEEEVEEQQSVISEVCSVTPSMSASNVGTRITTPPGSTMERTGLVRSPTAPAAPAWGFDNAESTGKSSATQVNSDTDTWEAPDRESVSAKRIEKHEFDGMRKKGWGERAA